MLSAEEELQAQKSSLLAELQKSEKQVYEHEGAYLAADYSQMGTVLKGLEGFLSSKEALKRRPRQFRLEDRLFSLSSKSSPATKELEAQESDFAEAMITSHVGRGKGAYAYKGIAQKGRR